MSGTDPELVPDDVIPHQHLPPLEYRDMPKAIPWKAMIGPSIILAGLSLGSGEFMLWPHITYKAGFVFFWACLLGVMTQYFLNMEIERYTLVTGESAITGFCRMSKHWAWIMLICNIVPMAWPGWASGAATTLSWLIFGPVDAAGGDFSAPYTNWFAIAGLVLVGVVLTSGPVVYNTVEKIQTFLVASIMIAVVVLAIILVKPYAVTAMFAGAMNLGEMPPPESGLAFVALLGALAFAGAGGTLNLGQSNYIKDKGYGMGAYIGTDYQSHHGPGRGEPRSRISLQAYRRKSQPLETMVASGQHRTLLELLCDLPGLPGLVVTHILFDLLQRRWKLEARHGKLRPGHGFHLGRSDDSRRHGKWRNSQDRISSDGNRHPAHDRTGSPRCDLPYLGRHRESELPARQ